MAARRPFALRPVACARAASRLRAVPGAASGAVAISHQASAWTDGALRNTEPRRPGLRSGERRAEHLAVDLEQPLGLPLPAPLALEPLERLRVVAVGRRLEQALDRLRPRVRVVDRGDLADRVPRTNSAIAGQSETTTGRPACRYSKSLFGKRDVRVRIPGERVHADVGVADEGDEALRGHLRHQMHPLGDSEPLRAGDRPLHELVLERDDEREVDAGSRTSASSTTASLRRLVIEPAYTTSGVSASTPACSRRLRAGASALAANGGVLCTTTGGRRRSNVCSSRSASPALTVMTASAWRRCPPS